MWSWQSTLGFKSFKNSPFLWIDSKSLSCHTFVSAFFIFICFILSCSPETNTCKHSYTHVHTRSHTHLHHTLQTHNSLNLPCCFQSQAFVLIILPASLPMENYYPSCRMQLKWNFVKLLISPGKRIIFFCAIHITCTCFISTATILGANDWVGTTAFTKLSCLWRARPESFIFILQAPVYPGSIGNSINV